MNPARAMLSDVLTELERLGHTPKVQRTGQAIKVEVESAPGALTILLFDHLGKPVTYQDYRQLREVEHETQESGQLSLFQYDTADGVCTEKSLCPGLRLMLDRSCMKHGGVVGLATEDGRDMPDVTGFMPPEDHREGVVFLFNYCPCCGEKLPEVSPESQRESLN